MANLKRLEEGWTRRLREEALVAYDRDCVQWGATGEGPSLIYDILSHMLSTNCVFKIIHRVLFFSSFVPPGFM